MLITDVEKKAHDTIIIIMIIIMWWQEVQRPLNLFGAFSIF